MKHMELALTSTNERDCIRNGLIDGNNGHRAVVFKYNPEDNKVVLRPMISIISTETYYGWNASVQALKIDDYIIISAWEGKKCEMKLFHKNVNGLKRVRNWGGTYVNKLLSKLPKNILEFLKPRGGGPSYLPSGLWRSKYDMNEKADINVIKKFISPYLSDQDWLDFVVGEAALAPRQHLIMDWESPHVKPMPLAMSNHEEIWVEDIADTSNYLVHNSMVWILLHENGDIEFVELEPTSGHFYTGKSREVIKTYTGMPKAIPSSVTKAIQINLGAYEKDERSYGARWYLYKR